jgi:hypothetical protein
MKQCLHDRWIESRVWLILWVTRFRQLLESIRPEATMQRLEFTLLTVFTVAMLPMSFLTSPTPFCKLLPTDFITYLVQQRLSASQWIFAQIRNFGFAKNFMDTLKKQFLRTYLSKGHYPSIPGSPNPKDQTWGFKPYFIYIYIGKLWCHLTQKAMRNTVDRHSCYGSFHPFL